jgi:hypothetical protein
MAALQGVGAQAHPTDPTRSVGFAHMSNLREIATAKLRGTPVEKPPKAVVGPEISTRLPLRNIMFPRALVWWST